MNIYAAEFDEMTYEGGFAILSLHSTKKGAWKAIHEHKENAFTKERERSLQYGIDRYAPENYLKSWQAWRIRKYELRTP
jgi:hypothetical protein